MRMDGLFLLALLFMTATSELNVFIIPHSHCDPGWLNTFEGYFTQQVNRILTSVTDQLLQDPKKKFVWAEISFFQLWYERQAQQTRDDVARLVKDRQLEFVAGGWVQNDEANANFDIVIDQVTEGHDFLHRVFGVVPRIAWQIDPFGHSSLTPSLFARMGFEALVINRIHYSLKASFKDSKSMEFLWTGSQSLGNASEIFTHVLHTHYAAPQGFDWEEHAQTITPENVNRRAADLADMLKRRASAYRTNNLLVPFGDDFKFQNAAHQFSNMDQLIKEINSRHDLGVNIKYATVSEYFEAVAAASKNEGIRFPTYNGDFFPYADNDDSYWTGYYTSRPNLKGHSRGTDSILRAAEGLYALGRLAAAKDEKGKLGEHVAWEQLFDGLIHGRRNAALVQHHDGITGTAKQFVANDYKARLTQAREASFTTITEMARILLADKETPSLTYDLKTFSFDAGTETYAIVVHNPLGWVRRKYVRLMVTIPEVLVTTYEGESLDAQILPVYDAVTLEPSLAVHELYFMVEVPPMGIRTYFLSKALSAGNRPASAEHHAYQKNFVGQQSNFPSSSVEIQNEHYVARFQTATGLLEEIRNKDADFGVAVHQELVDYKTSRSGAYIMRPDVQGPVYSANTPIKMVVIKGTLVSQVCTYFYAGGPDPNFETSVCVRLFSSKGLESTPNVLEVGGYLEVVYNVIGRRNCETVGRFSTNITTNRVFYTDNGLEIRERRSEGKRTENHYYPNLSVAYIQNAGTNIQFTILSRQAMGTHSRDDGVIEQMVHRALGQDDGRGLGEPNNDFTRIEVVVYLALQPIEPSVRMARRLALALQHQPRLLHATAEGGAKGWLAKYKPYYYPFVSQLPHNIHLLSFKARDAVTDDIIFRLVHIYEVGQHGTFSEAKEINLNELFQEYKFESTRERSLALSLNMDEFANRKPGFLASADKLRHASGIAPTFVQGEGEKQNTEEEGVFISQAALEEKRRLETEQKKKQQEEAQAQAPEVGNNDDDAAKAEQVKRRLNRNPLSRKLHEAPVLSGPPAEVLMMAPMQIKSFFVQLVPRDASELLLFVATKPPSSPNDTPVPTVETPLIYYAQITDLEVRAFFGISIVGSLLLVLVFLRLRRRNRNRLRKGTDV